MTYAQLLSAYKQQTGKNVGTDAQNNEFNQWTQGVMQRAGTDNWEGVPDDIFSNPGKYDAPITPPALPGTTTSTPTPTPTPTTGVPNTPSTGGNTTPPATTPTTGLGTLTADLPPASTATAPTPTITGGNYNQVQNAVQGGQFATVGQSQQSQSGSTTQNTTGTSTTKPVDTLGFGDLLKGQATNVAGTDATSRGFLEDLVKTGGSSMDGQFDKAIRQSLTGPQITGAGDSARARMGGYAAADIARQNVGQRLQAAQQLQGPTGLANLSQAANPYIGQTNTTSGSTTGLSNLITKAAESQAGSTAAQSSQAGAGQIPQGQPVKTGGCVLCTAAIGLNLPKSNMLRVLRRVISYKLTTERARFSAASKGYFHVFTPFAAYLLSHPTLAQILWPLARAVVYEELRVSGRRLPLRVHAWLIHWVGHVFCSIVGVTFKTKGYVDDSRILELGRKNNILFEVQS